MKEYFFEKKLFIYGFLLTSIKLDDLTKKMSCINEWFSIKFGDYTLYIHPEEKVCTLFFEKIVVVIVGDIFVAHGYLTIRENVRRFVLENDWDSIDNLSGRFSIFVYKDNDIICFNDPIGSKTIYYSSDTKKSVIASHTYLIALVLGLKISSEISTYIKMDEYKLKGTRFLPGDLTMYDNVFGLCPNNYYSLKQAKAIRFWPRSDIAKSSLENLEYIYGEYFLNFINYINKNHYIPVFGLTAGVDTRATMSAFSALNINFELVTWNRSLDPVEIKIINNLQQYLGRKHYWLNTKEVINTEVFKYQAEVANMNSGLSRGNCSLTSQMNQYYDNKKYLFVRGLGGEIIRGMFNRSIHSKNFNKKFSDLDFIVRLYNTAKLTNVSRKYKDHTYDYLCGFMERNNVNDGLNINYDLGDLIYWEQRMGMWASNLHNEMDSALKGYSGINSRKIYETAYGLPSETRFVRKLLLELGKMFDKILCDMPYA